VLIGRRVRLRRAGAADAELAAGWFSDGDYLGAFYNIWPRTPAEMERSFSREVDRETEGFFFIVRTDTEEDVGTAGYLPYSVAWLRGLELWWHVHPDARAQGFATEAACVLVNHLFGATTIERLQATVVVGNDGSGRVAERAGLRLEGVHRRPTS
jgi:RimJ/RimL family protein N-acetyltransferase